MFPLNQQLEQEHQRLKHVQLCGGQLHQQREGICQRLWQLEEIPRQQPVPWAMNERFKRLQILEEVDRQIRILEVDNQIGCFQRDMQQQIQRCMSCEHAR